jgi:hypothetical protein
MNSSLTEFKAAVLDRLLDFLWQQWAALGVAGYSTSEGHRVIDPESLLLLSLTVCRYDARLFDEILDWLMVNGPFLNIQRLKNIEKQLDFQCKAQLSAVAELLGKNSSYALKWKNLSTAHSRNNPEPLFYFKDGKPLPVPNTTAPEFYAHGLLRGPIHLRGYSQHFPQQGAPTLLLRLRALLGVNSRCELLCLLGSVDEIHPSDVARQTGYYPRTTQNALAEMAGSGVVRVRTTNREKRYCLQPGVLDKLLLFDGKPTKWCNWAPLFRALEILCLGITDLKLQHLDPLLLASELRRLAHNMSPLLGDAGWGQRLSDDKPIHGEKYTEVFFQDIKDILKHLNQ